MRCCSALGRRPEMGVAAVRIAPPSAVLLKLRKEMDLFANLRPAVVFDALADASALKRELVLGLDIMIVRELTGGIYFGTPRGVETLPDGTRRGINTEVYTEAEIERVLRAGFELAESGNDGSARSTRRMSWNPAGCGARSPSGCTPTTRRSSSASCMPTIAPMQLVRNPQAIRRDRHQQSVRRHSVGLRGDGCRLARHAAPPRRSALRTRAAGARRSTSRCMAAPPTSLGKNLRQPAGLNPLLRDDAAAIRSTWQTKPAWSRTPCVARLPPGCAPPTSSHSNTARVSTRMMGDTILRELEKTT